MSDCIFCKIVGGDLKADVVHDGREVLAFRDINPQAPTHIQIIPKRHVAHIADYAPDSDASWLSEMFTVAADLATAEGLGQGYRLVVNNGPLAGQSVFHVHLHLLGGRPLRWPPG